MSKIWLNGKLINQEKAQISILTHALHYGSGVFEGIRFYQTDQGPAVFRLSEHVKRLFNSAKALDLKINFTEKEVKQAILELIKKNKLQEGYVRPIVFYDSGKMGLNPKGASVSLAIAAWSWGKYLGKESIKVKITKIIRLHPGSVFNQAKVCGYYVNSIFATLEARKQGFDEALLLDYQGNIAEGPGENIFFVKNNVLYTPELNNSLNGLTRQSIIKIAQDLGIKTIEKKIKPKEIEKFDEAFFTGTAVEICSIKKINQIVMKDNKITLKLKEAFEKIIKGKEKKYSQWLSQV